jgi:hypothetical protein
MTTGDDMEKAARASITVPASGAMSMVSVATQPSSRGLYVTPFQG